MRDEGAARIYRIAQGGFLGVCRAGSGRPSSPDGVCLSLVTGDVDAWYRRLVARGIAAEGPPKVLPEFGVSSFFLRDPDGHLIEVQQFDDPYWQQG